MEQFDDLAIEVKRIPSYIIFTGNFKWITGYLNRLLDIQIVKTFSNLWKTILITFKVWLKLSL